MSQSSWDRIWSIFHQAGEQPPEERSAYLDRVCDEPGLRSEVEALLAAAEAEPDFLEDREPLAAPAEEIASPEAAVGDEIGPYRVLRRVGEGGMGVVYEAEQTAPLSRRVALKLIKPGMDTREVVARFEAERQALALMDHPGIARVFDAGATAAGRPYFVMELVDGVPIDEFCDRERLPVEDRLELLIRVCRAIEHAHRKGILHRDLKPSNVLVDAEREPKVIDFGIAKATRRALAERSLSTALGRIVGTPEYMSPEQAALDPDIDTRADVWALGVVLYQLLTGVVPFDLEVKSYADIERTLRAERAIRPSTRVRNLGDDAARVAAERATDPRALSKALAGELDWITAKALANDRDERYGGVGELRADLERFLADLPVLAGPPSRVYAARKFAARNGAAVAVAATGLLLIAIATVLLALESRRLARALDREETERATAEQVSAFLTHLFDSTDPYSQEQGIDITLREVLDRAAERIDDELADQPVVQERLRFEIGEVYTRLGLTEEAEPLLRASLESRRQLLGGDHPEVGVSLQRLGEVAWMRGEFTAAEELGRQALAIQSAALPETADEAARSHDLIALARRELRDLTAAEEHHQRALDLRIAAVVEPERIAESHNLIGIVRRRQGDYEGAERSYQSALEIQRRELGESHPSVAQTLNNLALLLHVRGDYSEAERMFEELLPLRQRLVGTEHRDIEVTKANFAKLLADMGELERADRLYRESIELTGRLREPDHPRIAAVLNDHAIVLTAQERFAEAEAALVEALGIRSASLGDEHELTEAVRDRLTELRRTRQARERLSIVD